MARKKISAKANQPKMVITHRPTVEQVVRYILTGMSIFLLININRYGFDGLTSQELIETLYITGLTVGMWVGYLMTR